MSLLTRNSCLEAGCLPATVKTIWRIPSAGRSLATSDTGGQVSVRAARRHAVAPGGRLARTPRLTTHRSCRLDARGNWTSNRGTVARCAGLAEALRCPADSSSAQGGTSSDGPDHVARIAAVVTRGVAAIAVRAVPAQALPARRARIAGAPIRYRQRSADALRNTSPQHAHEPVPGLRGRSIHHCQISAHFHLRLGPRGEDEAHCQGDGKTQRTLPQ